MEDSYSDQPLPGPEAEQNALEDHIALIFETAEERLAAITPLIKVGLEKGELCLYISNEENDQGIVEALKAEHIDVEKAVGTGGLILTSKKEIYFKLGRFDPDWTLRVLNNIADLARSYGFTAMRIMTEMTWTQENVPGVERWPEYEAKLNALSPGLSLRIICQYDRRAIPPEAMMVAIKAHPKIVSKGAVSRNRFHVPSDRLLGGDYAALELEQMLDTISTSTHSEAELQNRDLVIEQMRASVENSGAARQKLEAAVDEARRRFNEFAERSSDWCWELDEEGRYSYSSPRVRDILGLSPEEIVGRSPLDMVSQDEADRVSAILTRTMSSRAPITALEKEVRHKDGHTVFLEMNGTPLFDRDGGFRGYRGIDRDITGRKSSKQAIDESRRRAEESAAEVAARDQRIRDLEEAVALLRSDQAERDAALASIQAVLVSSQQEMQNASEDLGKLRDVLTAREAETLRMQAAMESKQAELDAQNASLSLVQQNLMDKELEVSRLSSELERTKVLDAEKGTALSELTASFKQQSLELSSSRGSIAGMEESLNRKEEELVILRQQMDRMEAELKGAQTNGATLAEALARTKAELASKDAALAEVIALSEGSKADVALQSEEAHHAREARDLIEQEKRQLAAKAEQLRLDLLVQEAVALGIREAWERADKEAGAKVTAADEARRAVAAELEATKVYLDSLAGDLCAVREVLALRDAELAKKGMALSESDDRFRAVFEQAGSGIAMIDLDGRILEANERFHSMLGYISGELTGRSYRDITFRDDLAESAFAHRRLVAGEIGSMSAMRRYVRRLGSTIWANVTLSTVTDRQGSIRYIIAIVDDRTDQMLAELALKEKEEREGEERYRNVIESVPQGIWVLDSDGNTTFVNQQMAALIGFEPDEMIGRPASSFMDPQWREQQERDPDRLGNELRFKRKDGSDLWVMMSSMPILDQAGQSKGVIGLVIDITSIKAKEAEAGSSSSAALKEAALLRAIVDAIAAPFMQVSADGRIVKASPVLEAMLGAGALDGRAVHEAVPGLDLAVPGTLALPGRGDIVTTPVPLGPGEGTVITFAETAAPAPAKVTDAPSDSLAHDLNDSLTVIMGSVSLAKEFVIPEGRMYSKLKQIESASVTARDLASRLMASRTGEADETAEQPATLIKGKGKILLMDDDESILEATGDLLRYLGYTVDVARDGDEALGMCREALEAKQPFDLAILDLEINSGMGGREASQKLAAENPRLKLIVSSGYVTDPIVVNPSSAGFDAAIPKPYPAEILSKIVAGVLAKEQ